MSDDSLQPDLRWQPHLSNFERALKSLSAAVDLSRQRPLSQLEKQGVIQAFEFTHQLAWNVMKDFFYYQGNSNITGSRDTTREAYATGLIIDSEGWMEMTATRNKTSHTYNPSVAEDIVERIIVRYNELLLAFLDKMITLR